MKIGGLLFFVGIWIIPLCHFDRAWAGMSEGSEREIFGFMHLRETRFRRFPLLAQV
jgi:hypothetical protein